MDTGDEYFGRDDYDYWIEALSIDLDPSWESREEKGLTVVRNVPRSMAQSHSPPAHLLYPLPF